METLLGVLAGVYGIAASVVTTLVIRAMGGAPCGPPQTTCIGGINPVTVTFLILFAVFSLGVMAGAWAHGQMGQAGAVGVLWLSTVMLALLTTLGLFSVGVFFAPGMLGAVAASLFALVSLLDNRLSVRRVFELAAGALSGIAGIAALVFVFFMPSIQYESADFGGTFSVAAFYGMGRVLPALLIRRWNGAGAALIFGVVAFLVAGGASSNALRSSRSGRALLIVAVLALGAAAVTSQFVDDSRFYLHTVGIWLLPSLALALIAAALAFAGSGGGARRAGA